jgi:molybdopterin molybdotransferase
MPALSSSLPFPSADVPPGRVVSFEEARHLVEEHARNISSVETESVDLLPALGRVLAEAIPADRDFPPFDRATRDGYAVRAADVAQVPARLEVVGELKAGGLPDLRVCVVGPRQAFAIMTGAPLPVESDAVVMVEHTALVNQNRINQSRINQSGINQDNDDNTWQPDEQVEILRSVSRGDNFVPRGSEARAGQSLLDRGHLLDHSALAIAASVGRSRVQVFRRPVVAVLSTGDELVEINETPGPAQIRNSNSYSLAAQVHHAGGEAVRLEIAPDEPHRLRALIEEGLGRDLLLLTGGVSMGKYDLVEQVLAELNAEFYFTGAEIQPGRPVVFGSCRAGAPARLLAAQPLSTDTGTPAPQKKYFFGLPGNPVSTMVTFELFARPMIEALSGMKPKPLIFTRARLKSELRTKTGLKRFLPAILSGEFENAEVELARWQGSGDIAAMARSNCYVVVPPDRERIEAGEWVPLLMR